MKCPSVYLGYDEAIQSVFQVDSKMTFARSYARGRTDSNARVRRFQRQHGGDNRYFKIFGNMVRKSYHRLDAFGLFACYAKSS